MKTSILTLAIAFTCYFSFAQSNKEEIDLVQSMFGMEKKAMAAQFIIVDDSKKDAFWAAYDEYETKRKELGQKRINLLNRFVASYASLEDATLDQMIKEMTLLQGQTDKLISTYYTKFKKQAGTKPAAQFFQFENYLLSKVRAEIMENIPLIGEFERK